LILLNSIRYLADKRLEVNFKGVKMKATVAFLLFIGIVIIAHLNEQKQHDLDKLEKLKQQGISGAVAGNNTSVPEANVITSSPSHLPVSVAPNTSVPEANVITSSLSHLPVSVAPNTNVITGILFSGDESSVVLINGKIVYEGKCIGDIKVVSISKREVEFEKNGKRWTQQVSEIPNLAWQE
jgi:hypothetical protein